MPPKNYIPLDHGKMYFSTEGGLVPLGGVQEVEITEETDLDILGGPGPVRVIPKTSEFTASITLTEEASEALRDFAATVEATWRVFQQWMETLVKAVVNCQNKRVVHLAIYHRDPLVRKKNRKRLMRMYKKTL